MVRLAGTCDAERGALSDRDAGWIAGAKCYTLIADQPQIGTYTPASVTSSRIRALKDPGTLALACVLLLGVTFVIQPQFDPDYWWHVLVGDRILHGSFPRTDPFTFTATGHPFIVQEWGSETLLAALSHVGMWAVITVMAVATAAGFLFALARARRFTSSNVVLAVLALIGLGVGRTVFGPRSQMFTFACIALLMWLVDRFRRDGGRQIWWLLPLFAVWGNLHGGFTLGLGLIVVVLVADQMTAIVGGGPVVPVERRRALLLVFVASIAALVVNPNGIGVYRYAIGLLTNGAAQSNLDEWRSPSFHDPEFIPLAVLIALLIIVAPRARRVDLTDALVAAAGIILTLYAVRNLSMVIVTSVPLLADGLDDWRLRISEWRTRRQVAASAADDSTELAMPFVAAVVAVVAALSAGISLLSYADARNNDRSAAYPVAVADTLCKGPPARVFQPYGSAGWLLYELERGAQQPCARDSVFIFGDVLVMGPVLFQEYLNAAAAKPDTDAILNRHNVDAVWQQRGTPLATWLAAHGDWACVWGSSTDVVYARSNAAGSWPSHGTGCDTGGSTTR